MSLAASLVFCPLRPMAMARLPWATMTLACLVRSSSSILTMLAGFRALVT